MATLARNAGRGVAYLSVTSGPPDLFAQGLIGYGLFQALVLMRLLPWISRQPFTAAYWAFTFGVSALPFAMLCFVEAAPARLPRPRLTYLPSRSAPRSGRQAFQPRRGLRFTS